MSNNIPTNQTGGPNNTFGGGTQGSSQTNPFTADLKGEFTSNFGTNTNAVSQIFKEGGFVGQNKGRTILIGAAAIALISGVAFFVMSGDEEIEDFEADGLVTEPVSPSLTEPDPVSENIAEEVAAPTQQQQVQEIPQAQTAPATIAEPIPEPPIYGGGAIALASPADGATVAYDETAGPAEFSWEGGGGSVVFSRNASMSPEVRRVSVGGNSYLFQNPWPGTWYWRVENVDGASGVRSFTVLAPERRNIQIVEPAGGPVAGQGGVVTWQGDRGVTSYKVELSNGDWANPGFRFATAGTSLQLQGVTPGEYQLRVGAFSEVAGRWEYTDPVNVSVQ